MGNTMIMNVNSAELRIPEKDVVIEQNLTVNGTVIIPEAPHQENDAVHKQYVDEQITERTVLSKGNQIIKGNKFFEGEVYFQNSVDMAGNEVHNPALVRPEELPVSINASGPECVIDCAESSFFIITITSDCAIKFNGMFTNDTAVSYRLLVKNPYKYSVVFPETILWGEGNTPVLQETALVSLLACEGVIYGTLTGNNYRRRAFTATITSDTDNYNMREAAISEGWDGLTPAILNFIVEPDVMIRSNSANIPAMITGDLKGSTVTLTNNGIIAGKAGIGGAGGSVNGTTASVGYNGENGGTAFYASSPVSVINNGEISGGGGGGAGAGGSFLSKTESAGMGSSIIINTGAGGGGGGGGQGYGSAAGGSGGSSAASGGNINQNAPGAAGSAGSISAPGSAGAGGTATGNNITVTAGNGGLGGALGMDGTTATTGNGGVNGASGIAGAAGFFVEGNNQITWDLKGTCKGRVS